jgi:hypothetical protein
MYVCVCMYDYIHTDRHTQTYTYAHTHCTSQSNDSLPLPKRNKKKKFLVLLRFPGIHTFVWICMHVPVQRSWQVFKAQRYTYTLAHRHNVHILHAPFRRRFIFCLCFATLTKLTPPCATAPVLPTAADGVLESSASACLLVIFFWFWPEFWPDSFVCLSPLVPAVLSVCGVAVDVHPRLAFGSTMSRNDRPVCGCLCMYIGYVCVYVCVYVCMYVFMFVMYVCMHVSMCVCVCVCT